MVIYHGRILKKCHQLNKSKESGGAGALEGSKSHPGSPKVEHDAIVPGGPPLPASRARLTAARSVRSFHATP